MAAAGSRRKKEPEMSTLTPEERKAVELAAREVVAYREALADADVPPKLRPEAFSAHLSGILPEDGAPPDQVIADLVADVGPGLGGLSSPRFFGYVLGGSMPVGIAADMLVSGWGQNVGSSWETPGVFVMERTMGQWCVDMLGLPAGSAVGVVTGATVANTQGIMAARNALLSRQDWDVEDRGLFGAPEIPVLIGADAHSAPLAGLRYAGFGAGRSIRVATDDQGRILPDAMASELDKIDAPPLVVLQAGQINTGAFDPFDELVPMVHEKGGWVHVDGAFGLWLAAVPELAPRLAGVADADSWAVDLHKWLNAPFDAGLCIVRDRGALVRSMSARGAYLPTTLDAVEPTDTTFELSRRARGVPSYAILRSLGRSGVRSMITRHCALAERLAAKLDAEPGIGILNEIASNQVSVVIGEGREGDALTRSVLARVQARGRVYPSHGEWRGRDIIRCSIIGYAMTEAEIDLLAEEIITAARAETAALTSGRGIA
jgi:glutamate/tyrosine decarboxylase-like PLP-dependent enzyme